MVEWTSCEMWGRREPLGGGTLGAGSGAVIRKSVSSPLMLSAVLVSNHTPRPPLRPPFSPPSPIFGPL